MSGSSGNRGRGDVDEQERTCETIAFPADINSPQPGALVGLEHGTILSIQSKDDKVIAIRVDTGATVGSINWTYNYRLIECMEQGTRYQATVRSVDDGLVKVYVTAVKDH